MADHEPATRDVEEELRQLSCYTTPPERTLELFEAARAAGCPVAHSDEHEGFHLLLGYDDVKKGMADHGLYSSKPGAAADAAAQADPGAGDGPAAA